NSIAVFMETGQQVPTVHEEFDLLCEGQTKHFEAAVTLSSFEPVGSEEGAEERAFVACITVKDVTGRKAYEAKLRRLSQLDDLTGAFNRRELAHRIRESVNRGAEMAVFAIDLHRFATVNAAIGRNAGDQVLKAVSRRLMAASRGISADP